MELSNFRDWKIRKFDIFLYFLPYDNYNFNYEESILYRFGWSNERLRRSTILGHLQAATLRWFKI
jgi:hypothetical protein